MKNYQAFDIYVEYSKSLTLQHLQCDHRPQVSHNRAF